MNSGDLGATRTRGRLQFGLGILSVAIGGFAGVTLLALIAAGLGAMAWFAIYDATPQLPASEYSVLSAALNQAFVSRDTIQDNTRPILIGELTLEYDRLPTKTELSYFNLNEGIVTDFYEKNRKVHRVGERFLLPRQYRVMTKDVATAVTGERFAQSLFVRLTRPGIAPSGDTAIVYVLENYRWHPSTSLLILKKTADGKWRLSRDMPVDL